MNTKKICSQCGEKKNRSEFYRNRSKKDGLKYQCKECSKLYFRTKKGLIFQLYSNQKYSSKTRGHPAPTYSKEGLLNWAIEQNIFHDLHENWVNSGYESSKKPSVDRMDDYRGYSLDNIQLMTWGENSRKGSDDRKNGRNNKHNKTVLQFTRENKFIAQYHSVSDASRKTGISIGGIADACRGEAKTARGYIWMYKV